MSALDRIFEAAAEERAQGMRQLADRPRERRCAEHPSSPAAARIRSPRMELRAASGDGGLLHFQGYASVYDTPYTMWDMFGPYTEQVISGAGTESLAQDNLDVPLVLAHDSLRRIARTTTGTLTLSEGSFDGDDVTGLMTDAPALDPRDADVAYIAPKLESGLVDEMSFRFVITQGSWSPDWMEYHIEGYDVDRGDVAIVGYGANPWTAGAGLRSLQLPRLEDLTDASLRDLEGKLHAERRRRGRDDDAEPAASSMTFAELKQIAELVHR